MFVAAWRCRGARGLMLRWVRPPLRGEREGPLEVFDLAPSRCGALPLQHSVARLLRLREALLEEVL